MMKMAAFIGEILNKLFNFIVVGFQSNITKKGNSYMEIRAIISPHNGQLDYELDNSIV